MNNLDFILVLFICVYFMFFLFCSLCEFNLLARKDKSEGECLEISDR